MNDTMKVSLVNNALKMAIGNRKPNKGLIWHTDRGSQYASYSHKKLLQDNEIIQSMSRKGNCWDIFYRLVTYKTMFYKYILLEALLSIMIIWRVR